MNDNKNIQIKSIKRDIYFEYLSIKSLKEKYNLVSVDSDGFNFLIPINYTIDYSGSYNIYDTKGHIYFSSDKSNFSLDYKKINYDDYKKHMDKKYDYVVRFFNNYRNQDFIEIYKNGYDRLYMYYNGYYFKIYSNHKLSMNEYYDMYFILFSINDKSISTNVELLRELYYLSKNSLKYACNDEDILTINLKEHTDNIDLNISDIVVYNNEDYIKYKNTKNKVNKISLSILSNNDDNINVDFINSKWVINGVFKFGNVWRFDKGFIKDYKEITESNELSLDEKKNMLTKIIVEKKYSIDGYIGPIKKEFYSFVRDYMSRELTYELWNEFHIREFVDFNLIDGYDESLNDFSLYKLYMSNIYSDKKIFIDKLVMDSIVTDSITITPDIYILCISGFNGLFNKIKIKFNEEFNLIFR